MTNELQTKLDAILLDKNTNLLPENLKKDITCLGITGTLEAGSGSSNIKIFNTVDEMNASEGNNDGDIAIVYGVNPVEPNTTGFEANTLILPKELPANITIPSDCLSVVNADNVLRVSLYSNESVSNKIYFDIYFGTEGNELGGYSFDLYGRSSSSDNWLRYANYSNNSGYIFYLNNVYELDYNYKITSFKVSNTSDEIWNYIKFANISTIELYCYDARKSIWKICRSAMNISAGNLISGNTMLGGNGLVSGSLDLSVAKKLISIPAYSRNCFSNTSSNISIAEPDTYMMVDTTTFPEGLGDKRWIMAYLMVDMGMGTQTMFGWAFVLPDDNSVLYHVYNDEYSDRFLYNVTDAMHIQGNIIKSIKALPTPSLKEISNLKVGTEIETSLSNTGMPVSTYSLATGQRIECFATNAEIRDANGNVIRPAGPSAATTLKGQYYLNLFGEKVEGTYEPDYTELGTISPTEYDTAVSTSEDILGTTTE